MFLRLAVHGPPAPDSQRMAGGSARPFPPVNKSSGIHSQERHLHRVHPARAVYAPMVIFGPLTAGSWPVATERHHRSAATCSARYHPNLKLSWEPTSRRRPGQGIPGRRRRYPPARLLRSGGERVRFSVEMRDNGGAGFTEDDAESASVSRPPAFTTGPPVRVGVATPVA